MHLNVALNKQSVRKRTPGLFKEDRHIKHTRAGGYKPTLGVLLLLLRLSRTGKPGIHSAASRNVPLFFPPKPEPFGAGSPGRAGDCPPEITTRYFSLRNFPMGDNGWKLQRRSVSLPLALFTRRASEAHAKGALVSRSTASTCSRNY